MRAEEAMGTSILASSLTGSYGEKGEEQEGGEVNLLVVSIGVREAGVGPSKAR